MFRQRLKGGHRVGANTRPPAENQTPNFAPEQSSKNIGPSLGAQKGNVNAGWDWDIPGNGVGNDHQNQPLSYQQHNSPSVIQDFSPNQQHGQVGQSFQNHQIQNQHGNGVSSENQLSSEWGWGTEESWGDPDGSNLRNQPQQDLLHGGAHLYQNYTQPHMSPTNQENNQSIHSNFPGFSNVSTDINVPNLIPNIDEQSHISERTFDPSYSPNQNIIPENMTNSFNNLTNNAAYSNNVGETVTTSVDHPQEQFSSYSSQSLSNEHSQDNTINTGVTSANDDYNNNAANYRNVSQSVRNLNMNDGTCSHQEIDNVINKDNSGVVESNVHNINLNVVEHPPVVSSEHREPVNSSEDAWGNDWNSWDNECQIPSNENELTMISDPTNNYEQVSNSGASYSQSYVVDDYSAANHEITEVTTLCNANSEVNHTEIANVPNNALSTESTTSWENGEWDDGWDIKPQDSVNAEFSSLQTMPENLQTKCTVDSSLEKENNYYATEEIKHVGKEDFISEVNDLNIKNFAMNAGSNTVSQHEVNAIKLESLQLGDVLKNSAQDHTQNDVHNLEINSTNESGRQEPISGPEISHTSEMINSAPIDLEDKSEGEFGVNSQKTYFNNKNQNMRQESSIENDSISAHAVHTTEHDRFNEPLGAVCVDSRLFVSESNTENPVVISPPQSNSFISQATSIISSQHSVSFNSNDEGNMNIPATSIDTCQFQGSNFIISPSVSSVPSFAVSSRPTGTIMNLHAREGSAFKPPTSKVDLKLDDPQTTVEKIQTGQDAKKEHKLLYSANQSHPVGNTSLDISQEHTDFNENASFTSMSYQCPENIKQDLSLSDALSITSDTNLTRVTSIYPASLSKSSEVLVNEAVFSALPPNIHAFGSSSFAPSSPKVLDLSQKPLRENDKSVPPNFSRMVPGESTKGESSASASYQAPAVVPAMPSGRIVTGNDYPQPIPSRVKQEPSEVRSPPDGPDTGNVEEEISGVIPPVRSETIGSEGNAPNPQVDRSEDENMRRDRNSMDRERPYYSDRYQERRREGREQRDYYRQDYDSQYDRNRRHFSEDESDEDRRYSRMRHDRRPKGYRDGERYADHDISYGKERRKHDPRDGAYRYAHEEDPYFERRSDRSRPMSRSSSYGNLVDSETSQSGHHTSHHDFYDRGPSGRERGRDRDYARHRKGDEKERDNYHRGYPPYAEQYGSRDMYDPHSYYYYYQNYQKYLEQHPYYREYYRQYYGRYGYQGAEAAGATDEKTSTRSGRSSVNDEMKKSSVSSLAPYDPYSRYFGHTHPSDLSSQFRHDFLDQSPMGGFEPSPIYPEHGAFNFKTLPSGDVSGFPSVTDEASSEAVHRVTPRLFTGPHLRASFTPGGKLLLVLPNDPREGEKPTVQVRNVQKMLSIHKDYADRIQKIKEYPGPLTVHETHKDIVLRFCEERAAAAVLDKTIFDQESILLLWEYLGLLVKQNGNVCGADLANLLIGGRTCTPNNTPNIPLHEESESQLQDSSPQDEGVILNGVTQAQRTSTCQAHIQKFTEYLCLGRKKEAVDYAIREGLWGYAMTLAAKMDSVTHARVMSAFIQSIPNTDVLQTLIQHLSGKKPEVSKSYSAEKWGDWRQHLAIMISNTTGNPARDKGSIVALGDSLASANRIFAAHICYLAAGVELGSLLSNDSKLILIGSSSQQVFQVFATDEAIRCTEIYEFAKCLGASSQLSSFQSFKFIYALRLAECGFPTEALKYCEVISQAILAQPDSFGAEFASQVLELSLQLKYYDAHYQIGEGEVAEMPDPEWIQRMQILVQNLQYQESQASIQAHGAEETPQVPKLEVETTNGHFGLSTDSLYGSYAVPKKEEPAYLGQEIAQGPELIPVEQNREHVLLPQHQHHQTNEDDQSSGNFSQSVAMAPPIGSPANPHESSPIYDGSPEHQPHASPVHSWHQPQHTWQPESVPDGLQPQQTWQGNYHNQQDYNQQPEVATHSYHQPQSNQPHQMGHHPHQWERSNSEANDHKEPIQMTQNAPIVPPLNAGTMNQTYGGFSAPADGQNSPMDEKTEEEKQYWAMMSGKEAQEKALESSPNTNIKQESSPQENKEQDEDKNDMKKSQSFLGSLFGGWRKGNNQAKLPDDKNPSIVWDEQKRKWVNTDEGEAEDTPLAPPPPDMSVGGAPLLLNSMKTGGPRKSRYVDPVSNSGRTKSSTSPMMPPMQGVPPPGVTPPMMPGGPPPGMAPASMPVMSPQHMGQQPPLEGSPAPLQNNLIPESAHHHGVTATESAHHHGVTATESAHHHGVIATESAHHHGVSAGSQMPQEGGGPSNSVPMMAHQPQPMFFNPSQFQGQQNSAPTQPKRLGPSRRTFNQNR